MPEPFSGAMALGSGVLGGIGGLFGKKTKNTDMNTYAYNQNQRNDLAGMGFDRLSRIEGADPSLWGGQNAKNHPFWGGQDSWTTSRGILPEGQDLGSLFSGIMGGGGGGGVRAGHANAAQATADLNDLDLGADIYNLTLPEAQRQRLLTQGNEYGAAQAQDATRQLEDLAQVGGGSISDPRYAAQVGNIQRERLHGLSDTMRNVESSWFSEAGGRQAAARSQRAQILNEIAMQNAAMSTQASIANAGYQTSASSANAGLRAQKEGMRSQLGLALLGSRGEDESRMMQRYGMIDDMSMRGRSPTGQKTQQQKYPGLSGMFGGIASGLSAGGSMFGMGGDKGGYPDEYKNLGGAGYRPITGYGL